MVEIDFFGLGQIQTERLQPAPPHMQPQLLSALAQPGGVFYVTQCENDDGSLAWDIHVSTAGLPQIDGQDQEILNLLEAHVYSAQNPRLFTPPRRLVATEVQNLRRWLALAPHLGAQNATAYYRTQDTAFMIQTWRIPTGIQEANT